MRANRRLLAETHEESIHLATEEDRHAVSCMRHPFASIRMPILV
jgi:hypothetical protein